MSKHDYTKHSNKNYNKDANRPKPEVRTSFSEVKPAPVVIPEPVVETVETVALPAGRVVNCVKLNVREKPDTNAEVVCQIQSEAEVIIDLSSSTKDFYKVCTEHGIEGYCMKQYIEVKQ